MTRLGGVSADHVFDGAGADVPVVGGACGEGRAVVEGEGREVLGKLELALEAVLLAPVLEDFFLLFGEGEPFGD